MAGCAPREKIQLGLYRAVLTVPGGELPFGLELASENGKTVAYLINGEERARVDDVRIAGRKLRVGMPGYGNHLEAKLAGGVLGGEVVMLESAGREQRIPFAARQGEPWRFFREPTTDNADVTGRWAVTFRDQAGKESLGVAEFRQQHARVTGTFLTTTGDHRFLEGEVHGDDLYLSGFDGGHAYLHRARIEADGHLEGTFWSGLGRQEKWQARRDEKAALADPDAVTRVSDATWSFGFTFPDESGGAVSLADARFRGKVVLVTLAGSWSPNCHDEAAFLAPFYRERHDRGLEVIALMFEHLADYEAAAGAVKEFRRKFGIEYPTLIAGVSDTQAAARQLPLLNGVFAFPTTIFIDRTGRVRRIHTGFTGPATGEHFEELKRSFSNEVDSLLAERKEPEKDEIIGP